MCRPYYGSGVSEPLEPASTGQPKTPDHSPTGTAGASVETDKSLCRVSPWLYELEAPVHTCPIEGCNRELIRSKYPKHPNQYDRSRWKKAWTCPRHGPVEEVWENHDKEG